MNHITFMRTTMAAACAIALTGLAPPAWSGDPSKSAIGAWDLQEEVSALNGTAKVSAVLKSVNVVPNSIGNDDHAYQVIRCRDGALATYFAWPD